MKLVDPTDFDILEVFQEGRNVATNVAAELGHDRAYINTRLPHLDDQGLVDKIGPAANSGLYGLTDRGQAAIAYREQYEDVDTDRFESLVDGAR
jgi:hypothetical protein